MSATQVDLRLVERLSKEFGEDVYGVSIKLHSPELVVFRDRFIDTLRGRIASHTTNDATKTNGTTSVATRSTADGSVAGASATRVPKDGTNTSVQVPSVEDLVARHNPYNNRSGGHTSLVYLRGGDTTLAEAREMQANANARLEAGDVDRTVLVESLVSRTVPHVDS